MGMGYVGPVSNKSSDISGADGKSAYELALENGFAGTEDEWLESLKGQDGVDGLSGADGKSAYQIALDNGFNGSEQDWIFSLKGVDGKNGLSAYEIAVNNGFSGTEDDWLQILKGGDGQSGKNGLSAYDIAVNNGFTGTEAEWLKSLIGSNGLPGVNGTDGFSPTIKVDTENETEYILKITTTEGSFKTPNLKGSSNTDINIEVNWLDKITEVMEIADKINREVV